MTETGQTFVCEFADGEVTKMSVHCPKGPDLERGIALARVAYEARKKKAPPRILKGYFEDHTPKNGEKT